MRSNQSKDGGVDTNLLSGQRDLEIVQYLTTSPGRGAKYEPKSRVRSDDATASARFPSQFQPSINASKKAIGTFSILSEQSTGGVRAGEGQRFLAAKIGFFNRALSDGYEGLEMVSQS
jgi:hypothetical protein